MAIRFIVPEAAEISYKWTSFTHYFENERIAVLCIADAAFHTIPKTAMNEDGWREFRQMSKLPVRTF